MLGFTRRTILGFSMVMAASIWVAWPTMAQTMSAPPKGATSNQPLGQVGTPMGQQMGTPMGQPIGTPMGQRMGTPMGSAAGQAQQTLPQGGGFTSGLQAPKTK